MIRQLQGPLGDCQQISIHQALLRPVEGLHSYALLKQTWQYTMLVVGDEMISLDRRYSHANSINCQIPVQTDASCRRKGTKWTIPRASTKARFSVPF